MNTEMLDELIQEIKADKQKAHDLYNAIREAGITFKAELTAEDVAKRMRMSRQWVMARKQFLPESMYRRSEEGHRPWLFQEACLPILAQYR